jgi:predicted lipoprotein with Yx(FWY)xxD motif
MIVRHESRFAVRAAIMPVLSGLLVFAAALLASGCGGSSAAAPGAGSGHKVTVLVKAQHGVGTVLVNAQGYTLYMFARDNQRQVTCTSVCATTWPPLKLPPGVSLVAGPGVKASLLGSDPDPAGGRVVTYDGWPLYTYTADVDAGQATGQGIDLNGGAWYVMRPSGKPLKSTP